MLILLYAQTYRPHIDDNWLADQLYIRMQIVVHMLLVSPTDVYMHVAGSSAISALPCP